ncbi:EbsA family protein [Weissella sagaensis]|jgi:large-conductance mechanosensitive channel|uniref:EbsA family protein n=1 Tax=Weissella sagaensis TaxID=2559928 RepID=A0ABW1RRQ0_9LACO|nr:EbsA family protein [Weissella sagaensis]KAA8432289.1 pore-forming protein [Weissella paramesenteroides]QDJ58513.1 pore-forming protein [Weissella hellenica]KAA8439443.1 pore-forming protein [Weissella paramesenteroides]QEA57453.1 pore-forming protein [Weissella hellenica]UEG66617.1 EbsA family protein [Weissella hellenica]
MKGYYQPAGLLGLINWLWIIMIAMFALIMQLEVTHLNSWTIFATIVFLFIALLTYFRRRVTLSADAILIMPMIGVHTEKVRFKEMQHVQFTKRTVIFSYEDERYSYWMNKKFLNQLQKEIKGK